jgi:dipeptidyl aminopeptidase/acylaminoacyl peptidase
MKIKYIFIILITLIMLASCGPNPATQTVGLTQVPVTQTSTDTPTPIQWITFATSVYANATPYPTASAVEANAVAFIEGDGETSLWLANVDGSGERKLVDITDNNSWVKTSLIQWSPDGKWISYFSGAELWIVSRDGSVKRDVLSFPNLYTYIWSPDSSKIAYEQTKPWPAGTKDPPPITVGIIELATGEVSEISTHTPYDPMPISWSPDGRYLLYFKDFAFNVFEVDTHKVVQEIKTGGTDCSGGWNTWSPNSKWFFHSYHGNGRYSTNWICVSSLGDGSTRKMDVDGTTCGAVWDKTGNFLYFTAVKTNPDNVPKMDLDHRLMRYDVRTQKTERVLSLGGDTIQYCWSVSISPDGSTLELHPTSEPWPAAQYSFIIVDIKSLSTTKFTMDFKFSAVEMYYPFPVWSPDNQNIILFIRETEAAVGSAVTLSQYGSFYAINIKTGKTTIISGGHPVQNGIMSPIAAYP